MLGIETTMGDTRCSRMGRHPVYANDPDIVRVLRSRLPEITSTTRRQKHAAEQLPSSRSNPQKRNNIHNDLFRLALSISFFWLGFIEIVIR